ncbi:LuxR C-terminal-related transcriptional regulator [Streptosporangium sp. NPDC000396]|uniref:helix-turn-helix transcriptional regulator n=1 Tax=Streptosporangium sp. NPDC000396 TaxID=3366185 RepID=UPI0036B9B2A9
MPKAWAEAGDGGLRIRSALVAVRVATGLPVALGGPVAQGALRLGELIGTTTDSLRRIKIVAGAGVGGRAVALRRPVAVRDYLNDTTISHEYDWAIGVEGLRSLVAVPVLVSGQVRAVLYGALRQPVPVGDRVVDEVMTRAHHLARDFAAEEETERRVTALTTTGTRQSSGEVLTVSEREEVRRIFAELRTLATQVDDPGVRSRLESACERFTAVSRGGVAARPSLTPREVDTLAHVAVGCSNAEIAARLRVSVETVKSYLRSAMHKLGVHTRHAAVSAARSTGHLP